MGICKRQQGLVWMGGLSGGVGWEEAQGAQVKQAALGLPTRLGGSAQGSGLCMISPAFYPKDIRSSKDRW